MVLKLKKFDLTARFERNSLLKGKKKTQLLIKVLMAMEGLVLVLYIFNLMFYGYTDIFLFHFEAWGRLLATSTFRTMLVWGIPIGITAVGAAYNENAGVINIGLEGIMLWGAFAGVYFTYISGNPWIGVLGAMLVGFFNALLHAIFTITFKAEQIVTGVAINLFAIGMTDVITSLVWQPGRSDEVLSLPDLNLYNIPILGDILGFIRLASYKKIPIIGDILKFIPDPIDALIGHSILFYLILIIIPIAHLFLFRTKWGLRIRVIGEHPQAAATAGIPVKKYQYMAVIISGILAALGGALLTIGNIPFFNSGIVGGRGFTALAAMIFGKWTVFGAVGAAIFFGYFYSISIKVGVGISNFKVPNQFLQMIPFIIAIAALSGFIGRARPPKAIGRPYDPSED